MYIAILFFSRSHSLKDVYDHLDRSFNLYKENQLKLNGAEMEEGSVPDPPVVEEDHEFTATTTASEEEILEIGTSPKY